jgi:tetratricopeptide (TPR) repeat protein
MFDLPDPSFVSSRCRQAALVIVALVLFLIALPTPVSGQTQPLDALQQLIDSSAFDSALAIIDGELAEDSLRGFLWFKRDTILAAAGRTEDRIASLERTFTIWPNAAPFRLQLAEVLIGLQRLKEARQLIETVLERPTGQSVPGHYLSGRVYELEGVYDSAVVAYRRAWVLLTPGPAATSPDESGSPKR